MRTRFNMLCVALVFILSLCVGFMPIDNTSAEEPADPSTWIQISPVSQRLTLNPGSSYDLEIKVTNIGTEALDFRVYASPFFVQDITADPVFEAESSYTQIANWVSFAQTEYTGLAPSEAIEIPYQIIVPSDVPSGGQYAVIFAETINNNAPAASGGSIQTVSRVGSLIYSQVPGDTRLSGELSSVSQKSLFMDETMNATAIVKNTGNVDFQVDYLYRVDSIFGDELHDETISRSVLPGISRQFDMSWDEAPLVGLFNVTNEISFMNKPQFSETKMVLVAPSWLIVLTTILLVMILAIIVILVVRIIRSRRRSAK